MAATRAITIYQGDTYTHEITVQDDAGAPVDLSDRTWAAQIRAYATADTALADFAVDATDAATGVLVLSLTAAQTAALPGRPAVWDLQGTYTADSTVETLIPNSVVTVTQEVTR